MEKDFNIHNFYEYEERAHQMRAQAARQMGIALGKWVKARFSHNRVATKGKLA